MAITAPDLARLRGHNIIVTPHLNVVPTVSIGTATTAQYSTGTTIGITGVSLAAGLTVDTLPVGSMVWVGTAAGGHDVFTSSIRKIAAGVTTALYCHGSEGGGDPGVAVLEPVSLYAGGHDVTIFANLPLWAQLSRVYNSTFYKAYDVAYTDEGTDPAPVCNIGKWRRLVLPTGGTVDLTLTALNSVAWGAKTIDSWSWGARNSNYASMTGVSVVAGAGTNTATYRFTTAGFYMLSCTITDDGAGNHAHIAYCYVWVVDGTTYDDLHGWRVESDEQDRTGRRMTIIMEGDVAESTVYPGAAFLYSETSTYNGDTLTDGSVVDTFVGFIDEEAGIREIEYGRVQFTLISPSYILDQLPMATQYIEESASPADWTEITGDLSNPNGVAWYILAHHAPNMLKLFDFRVSLGDTLRNHIWTLNNSSVWGQLREIAPEQINIGCASEGALFVRDDPLVEDDTYRDALDVAMTWLVGDLRGDDPFEYKRRYRLKAGQVDGYAFAYNGSNTIPIRGTAPWSFQVEGVNKQVYNGLVVTYGQYATDIARITGHLFAKLNSPNPDVQLYAMRNFDTADPARMIWHKLTLAAAYDPRGVGWSAQRLLPRSVSRRWEQVNGEWLKTVDITMEFETKGQPGRFRNVPYNQDGAWSPIYDWGNLEDTVITEPDPPQPEVGPVYMMALAYGAAEAARAYSSTGYEGGTPVWEDISTGLSGAMRWATADPFNPKRYFAVGTDGVFVCEDITADNPFWVQIRDTSNLPAATASYGYHYIAMTANKEGWICILHPDVSAEVSFDYGATWQLTLNARVGSVNTDYLPHVEVAPFSSDTLNNVYCRTTERLRRSTDWGLTWTEIQTDTQMGFEEVGIGMVRLPLFRLDGTTNYPGNRQQLYVVSGKRVIGVDRGGNLAYSSNYAGTGTWTQRIAPVAPGDYGTWFSPAMRSFLTSTQNGINMAIVLRETAGSAWKSRFAYSVNGGIAWTQSANQPGYPNGLNLGVGINGWPYDDDIILTWWATSVGGNTGGLYLTYDKGASAWQNAIGNLVTGGIFTDSRIAYAELLLAGVQ